MNNAAQMVEMPAGDCKTTEIVKSFSQNGNEVFVSFRTEERCYGTTVILEQEKTRICENEKGITVVKINIVRENGIEKKIVELATVETKGEKTNIRRRQKMLKEKQLVQDYEIREEENKEYYYDFRNRLVEKSGLCRVKR